MSTTIKLNQRIVFAGLSRMSTDRSVIKSAFLHWNQRNTNTAVDIFDVVEMLVGYLGLDVSEKKALMLGLHTASAELYDHLKPVPTYILSDQEESAGDSAVAEAESKSQAAHAEVTMRYLQTVSLQLKRNDANTHKELVKAVADEGLGGLSNEVSAWAADGLNLIKFDPSVSVQDCQDLAHEFYVLVCDFIGPVETDVIVNKAITELSNLDEAREFSPQKLL